MRQKRVAHLIVLSFLILINTFSVIAGKGSSPLQLGVEQEAAPTATSNEFGRCVQSAPGWLGCGIYPSDAVFSDNLFPAQNMLIFRNPTLTNPNSSSKPVVLIVQDTPSIPNSKNYAFLKFNISKVLPQTITSGHAHPVNGSLWMYSEFVNGFQNASVRVYKVSNNNWNESTLTWQNMPSVNINRFETSQIVGVHTWYRWDVTGFVTDSLDGDGVLSLALIPGFSSWMNYVWFDSRNEQNMSKSPELDLYFVEPTLTIETNLPSLQIAVDNQTLQADRNGTVKVRLPWGLHKIAVPNSVAQGENQRRQFLSWTDGGSSAIRAVNLENNLTLQANFQTQYRLVVNSPFAATNGSGWYSPNQIAYVSIGQTYVFAEGFSGLLGVRYSFDHWSGDCTDSRPQCSVLINGPKTVNAIWNKDYMITVVEVLAIAAAGCFFLLRKRRRAAN